MTRKVEIGAPSLTGKGAELIAEAFAGAAYPINVSLTSHLNFDISLPEIDGMPVLCSVFMANMGLNKRNAKIHNEDQFKRLASSIEQIAELNNLKHPAITIEEIGASDEDHQEESEVANELSNGQTSSGVTESGGNDQASPGNAADESGSDADAVSGNAAADDNASDSDASNAAGSAENAGAAGAVKTPGRKHKPAAK